MKPSKGAFAGAGSASVRDGSLIEAVRQARAAGLTEKEIGEVLARTGPGREDEYTVIKEILDRPRQVLGDTYREEFCGDEKLHEPHAWSSGFNVYRCLGNHDCCWIGEPCPTHAPLCEARIAGAQGGFCRNVAEPESRYCDVHGDVAISPQEAT